MKLDQVYKVGGFVRDSLLGLEPKDVDYVVIGESPESMLSKGYTRVGHAFPVFLHPDTRDEYALGRSEFSSGDGHKDFLYEWAGVTLEQDLGRRDFTINAMAMMEDGTVYDPYGGRDDLASGTLRHVGPGFEEDPLRVLRGARFAARYGFKVAPETMELMTKITQKGMLSTLSAERIWQETEKALLAKLPHVYFEVLDACGALEAVFPELHKMKGVPQSAKWHAEGDVWVHTLMVLEQAGELSKHLPTTSRVRIMAGALMHDLGKAQTPHELLWAEDGTMLGKHHGHDDPDRFSPSLNSLAKRICMPTDVRLFAHTCAQCHQDAHGVANMGRGLANMYERLGLDRQLRHDPAFLEDFLVMCHADSAGRYKTLDDGTLHQDQSYPEGEYVRAAMAEIAKVKPGPIMQAELGRGQSLEEAKGAVLFAQRKAGEAFRKARRAKAAEATSLDTPAP